MTDSERQLNLFAAQGDFEQFMKGQGLDQKPAENPPEEDA
jgi:hypothetical protein